MIAIKAILLANASATGAGVEYRGGKTALHFMGTIGAATVKLQVKGPDNTTWLDVATITAAGVTAYDLAPGQYRIELTGGAPSGIYADLIRVPY